MHYDLSVLPHPRSMLSGFIMSDQVVDRIERALKRIERAAAAGAEARARLENRNRALRARIESAIADLDMMIAQEAENAVSGDESDALDADMDGEAQG